MGLGMLAGLTDLSFLFEGYLDLVSRHPQCCFGATLSQIHLGCSWLVLG